MRGEKGANVLPGSTNVRITPACAGKEPGLTSCSSRRTDHPRVRGEKIGGQRVERWRDHPRVRGEKLDGLNDVHGLGSPPRARGEGLLGWSSTGEGSPPRARGEVLRQRPRVCYDRITPACAGRRNPTWRTSICCRITPACAGRSNGFAGLTVCSFGITPACAGRRNHISGINSKCRITPACAGRSLIGICGKL